jgi:hypothetical protein
MGRRSRGRSTHCWGNVGDRFQLRQSPKVRVARPPVPFSVTVPSFNIRLLQHFDEQCRSVAGSANGTMKRRSGEKSEAHRRRLRPPAVECAEIYPPGPKMSAEKYRKDFALSLVNNLPPLSKSPPFPHIAAADVVAGLRDRVNDPHKQDQGAASLCGPAAFFYVLLNFKPELYVQYVIDLFTTGRARIGALTVEPSHGCRSYNPPPAKISGVYPAHTIIRNFFGSMTRKLSVTSSQ